MLTDLNHLLGENKVFANESMGKHTTFRIGGNARFLVVVENIQELVSLLDYLKERKENYYILGNGSNLLISDEGYDGVMIQLKGEFQQIKITDKEIYVGAGAMLSTVAHQAMQNSLAGMEFASGIPGTIGGALVMNAGAYGGEMSQIVHSVEVLGQDGQVHSHSVEEMEFGYRMSRLKRTSEIALFTKLLLTEGKIDSIKSKMEEYKQQRVQKQPLEYPSAGSTFKRPEGYFAGKLIMDAGLKGYRVGDAMVSEKHAGFVINAGNATAAEVKQLMKDVSDKVYEKYQVRLEPEVIVL